jgi:hypothetical protein
LSNKYSSDSADNSLNDDGMVPANPLTDKSRYVTPVRSPNCNGMAPLRRLFRKFNEVRAVDAESNDEGMVPVSRLDDKDNLVRPVSRPNVGMVPMSE